MALWKPKKIIFIGTQSSLLKILSKENDTEVISSINFLETLAMSFLPNLIIAETLTQDEIMYIRKIDRFTFIPILVTTEKFTKEEINALISFPNIILCNSNVSLQPIFVSHLKSIMTKGKTLSPARTAAIAKKTILFLDSNIGNKFTRKEISQAIGTDEDYLTRIFHREMGMTLWNYLNILRLEEARNLLVYTGLSIKEIAERCGFTTAPYFCNCFKKHYNISPGDVRNNRN